MLLAHMAKSTATTASVMEMEFASARETASAILDLSALKITISPLFIKYQSGVGARIAVFAYQEKVLAAHYAIAPVSILFAYLIAEIDSAVIQKLYRFAVGQRVFKVDIGAF